MAALQDGDAPGADTHDGSEIFQLVVDQPPGHISTHIRDDLLGHAPGSENTRNENISTGHQKNGRSETQHRGTGSDKRGGLQNNASLSAPPTIDIFCRMEDGEPLGRCEIAPPPRHHANSTKPGRNTISLHKGDVGTSLPTGLICTHYSQDGHNPSPEASTDPQPRASHSEYYNSTNIILNEEGIEKEKCQLEEHQKGSSGRAHDSSGTRDPPSGSRGPATKTCKDSPTTPRHVVPIHHQQSNASGSTRIGTGDKTPLKPPHLTVSSSSKASTAAEYATLPLHVKKVEKIDLDKVMALAKGLPQEKRLKELLHFVKDPNYHLPMMEKDIDATPISKFTNEDISLLYSAGQISPIDREHVKGTVVTFTVTEQKLKNDAPESQRRFLTALSLPKNPTYKNRRRPIQWPRWDNDATTYEAEIEFATLKESLQQPRHGDSATCADLAMSFSQIAFSSEVSRFHCFKDNNGKWWKSEVMLMGASYSCEIMHLIMEILATARQNVLLAVGKGGVRIQVHVDNVRYLHPNPFYVQEAMTCFLANATFVRATVNMDADINPHTFGTSFGVVHDYHENLAALTEKHLRKITQAREDIKKPLTVRRACEIMGLLFYGSTVLKINLAHFYFPIKWYRRLAHDFERGSRGGKPFGLDTVVTPWPSIEQRFDWWMRRIGSNVPASHEKSEPTITLFCDASKVGCGAVLIDGVCPSYRQYGASFTTKEYSDIWDAKDESKAISLLETKAAAKAISHFRHFLEGNSVRLYIDNTSLIGALSKTHSKSFALNEELLHLIREMEKTGASFDVQYVPTESNLADRPSRRHVRRGPALPQ